MQEKLYFYYTNDLHSHFEQWPKVVQYLNQAKEQRKLGNDDYWIVDIGDHMDRVHPIAEAFKGKSNVQLLNDAAYNLATIGNNEGITLEHSDLFHLYDDARFQVICANLHSLDDVKPAWLQPYTKLHSINGVDIGIIGLTAPFNAFYELLDWHITDPYKTLERYINEIKESSDIIILLSHLGITEDQEIARKFPEIDVIIGGHTHHLLRTGETVDQTLITAAGKNCAFIGEVILTWDHTEKKLVDKEAYATDITHLPNDKKTIQSLQHLRKAADEKLGDTVVQLEKKLEVNWFKNTLIMQQLTNTLKAWTDADCAMLNAGVLLDHISPGNVTYKDVHRICPHPINPCVVTVKGDELIEVVRASFTRQFIELPLKGFGFRGKVIGKMIFSGLDVKTQKREDGEEYVVSVMQNGNPIDQEKTYSLATADTFTFGRLLPEVARSDSKRFFLPEFLRDLLAHTLRNWK
ncbi:bifunctional metallophosphatase/5'-nucleotidase [Oceanobacillus halotolerans]|uniref:bifunctional metallophosphatase/5'-nucleotidase n=1 Tax=Oceanobacillus halotolerans TaxID=2663380 RepID=UPI0013D9F9E1|nr:bifunctional UDP-sugar hydrolase/5'-nucleotidase [Oceanobacillus halotolerans]